MAEADAGDTTARPTAHGWRRLVFAVLIMALSMAIATVLVPPDSDLAAGAGDVSDR